jgi:glycosyltransferase involved in cell wall biosynthesis
VVIGPQFPAPSGRLDALRFGMGIWYELARDGFEVTRICAVPDERTAEPARALGCGRLTVLPLVPSPRRPLVLARFRQLATLLSDLSPHVVHCIGEAWQAGTITAVRAGAAAGVPTGVQFSESGQALRGFGGQLRRRRGRSGMAAVTYLVGSTEAAVRLARSTWRFRGPAHVSPPVGIPREFFQAAAGTSRSRAATVLFAGRLVPEKGIADVLEVARRLTPEGVRCRVVGDGPLRGVVETAHQAGLVEYLGPLPRPEVAKVMGETAVTLVPSRPGVHRGAFRTPVRWEELFGLVIAESLAAGAPVVGYRSGSIPEVAGTGGWLVPVGDVAGLAAAARRLLSDEPRRSAMAERGRQWAGRFAEEQLAARLAGLWAGLGVG